MITYLSFILTLHDSCSDINDEDGTCSEELGVNKPVILMTSYAINIHTLDNAYCGSLRLHTLEYVVAS